MRTLWLIVLLTACTSDSGETGDTSQDDSAGSVDSGGSGDSGSPDVPDGTNGSLPEVALEAPDFAATNRDGGARDREDLLGHPTVMWFYPAAGTFG